MNQSFINHRMRGIRLFTVLMNVFLFLISMQFSLYKTELLPLLVTPRFALNAILIVLISLIRLELFPRFFMGESPGRRVFNAVCIVGMSFVYGCLFQGIFYYIWRRPEYQPPVEDKWFLFGVYMAVESALGYLLLHLKHLFHSKPRTAATLSSFYLPIRWYLLWSPSTWCAYNVNYMFGYGVLKPEGWQKSIQSNPGYSSWLDNYGMIWSNNEHLYLKTLILRFLVANVLTSIMLIMIACLVIMGVLWREHSGGFRNDLTSVQLDKKVRWKGFDPGKHFEQANRLVLLVTPEDILDEAPVSFLWTRLINRYGSSGRDTSGTLGFVIGDCYIVNPMAYSSLTKEQKADREMICLLVQADSYLGKNLEVTGDYTERQYKLIEDYLTARENEGFTCAIWEQTYSDAALSRGHIVEKWLFGDRAFHVSPEHRFPLEMLDSLSAISDSRQIYRKLSEEIGGQGDVFLEKQSRLLLARGENAALFYDLMKMAEYCIHIRALLSLADPDGMRPKKEEPFKKEDIIKMSFGAMEFIQRDNGTEKKLEQDFELIGAYRRLSSSGVKPFRLNMDSLSETIVQLRNRYIGHGTMVYHVSDKIVYDLAIIVRAIVKYYLSHEHRIGEEHFVLPGIYQKQVPVMVARNRTKWYFTSLRYIKEEECANYIDFATGKHMIMTMQQKMTEDVILLDREETEKTPETGPYDLPDFPNMQTTLYHGAVAVRWVIGRDSGELLNLLSANLPNRILIEAPIDYDTDYMRNTFYGISDRSRRSDEEVFHHFLIAAGVPVSLIFVSGTIWDSLLENCLDHMDPYVKAYRGEMGKIVADAAAFEQLRCSFGNSFLPVSEIRVIVAGESKYREQVRNMMPWIRDLRIEYFEDMDSALHDGLTGTQSSSSLIDNIKLFWLYNTWSKLLPILNKMNWRLEKKGGQYRKSKKFHSADFTRRSEIYRRILGEVRLRSPLLYTHRNIYNAGFLRNVMCFENVTASTIALFDYLEFTWLTMMWYARDCHSAMGKPMDHDADGNPVFPEDQYFEYLANYKLNARQIRIYMPEDAPCYEDIRSLRIPVPVRLQQLHGQLEKYLPVKFQFCHGGIGFQDLACILGIIRNATKGHGYIQEEFAVLLWETLLYYAMMTNRFLHLNEFMIVPDPDPVNNSRHVVYCYKDGIEIWTLHLIMDENMVCPLCDHSRDGKWIYMNYFKGKIMR